MAFNFARIAMACALCVGVAAMPAAPASAAKVDKSKSTKVLQKLKRVEGELPAAAVYEVRSAVPGIDPGAAAEMFMTALIKSGRFKVVERVRLNEGVGRERQLMANGIAAPVAGADAAVTGARYVFEVVISEGNPGANKSDHAVRVGGVSLARASNVDRIGMDIRITDVATAEVLDSVNVTEAIKSNTKQIGGLGSLAKGALGKLGKRLGDVDAQMATAHKDGVERAVRACIEIGVAELSRRLSPTA